MTTKQGKDAIVEESIIKVLTNIEEVTGSGATYHGLYDDTRICNKKICAFCRAALEQPATRGSCRYACSDATIHALASGEPYFYRCWAGPSPS